MTTGSYLVRREIYQHLHAGEDTGDTAESPRQFRDTDGEIGRSGTEVTQQQDEMDQPDNKKK